MQVTFENVSMKFADKEVLKQINFTLPSSELISFLGPSGCGKSTTLYLISGLLTPNSGKIYFDNIDVTNSDPVKRGVGLVFQNYALYPHMTIKDNIMFPLKMAKMAKSDREDRVLEMAELTKITDQLDKYPGQLSGGQQQRVAISRALAKSPRILLMDEPLSNLDARLRLEMREEIRRIQQETGITTVFVTHDQEEALSIADQVMVLNDGEIQQFSDPVSLYQWPNNLFVAEFIGNPQINIFSKKSLAFNPNHGILNENWKYLGVRPEDLEIGTEYDHMLKAEVDRVDYVGKEITVHCNWQGEYFLATDLKVGVQPGDKIYLRVDTDRIRLFDQEGNRLSNFQN